MQTIIKMEGLGGCDSLQNIDCSKKALDIAKPNQWPYAIMVPIQGIQFIISLVRLNIITELETND